MTAATGSGFAERCVSPDPEPADVPAGTAGADDAPQAVTEARSVTAKADLRSLVLVMSPPFDGSSEQSPRCMKGKHHFLDHDSKTTAGRQPAPRPPLLGRLSPDRAGLAHPDRDNPDLQVQGAHRSLADRLFTQSEPVGPGNPLVDLD
ncbi:hypothetical protein [Streptomyces carpinensis]|uniref:Uncharacterized protein n=1 Tax=Streptomyces carpinensis TaxID=66369 RepID=A0ABV1VXV4_9ACTN|nr:hypothetical protein [Streptomyces carpinensis]